MSLGGNRQMQMQMVGQNYMRKHNERMPILHFLKSVMQQVNIIDEQSRATVGEIDGKENTVRRKCEFADNWTWMKNPRQEVFYGRAAGIAARLAAALLHPPYDIK